MYIGFYVKILDMTRGNLISLYIKISKEEYFKKRIVHFNSKASDRFVFVYIIYLI